MLLGVLLLLVLAGCGGDDTTTGNAVADGPVATGKTVSVPATTSGSKTLHVKMESTKFVPDEVTVETGTTIIWVNEDTVKHNVTSSDGSFQSEDLVKGGAYSFTFREPGTYEYTCTLHPPGMKGTVIVED